ncbi:YidH family protein [Virgibacillus xinjiangensis]|uniref:YidH family protein n=1 Tax=Virgibacillus xinjiangensis TaxID=393090 RepID=A0ABV7D033_9BACI
MKSQKTKQTNREGQSSESKYIQQHLANERTYLAWLRTAIAIIGVGFLVTNMHYATDVQHSPRTDMLANIIGLASVSFGMFTIVLALLGYIKKAKSINDQTFHSSKKTLVLTGILIIIIALIFAAYFLMLN